MAGLYVYVCGVSVCVAWQYHSTCCTALEQRAVHTDWFRADLACLCMFCGSRQNLFVSALCGRTCLSLNVQCIKSVMCRTHGSPDTHTPSGSKEKPLGAAFLPLWPHWPCLLLSLSFVGRFFSDHMLPLHNLETLFLISTIIHTTMANKVLILHDFVPSHLPTFWCHSQESMLHFSVT